MKISKETGFNTMYQLHLMDIYRTLHPTMAYMFFSSAQGTFSRPYVKEFWIYFNLRGVSRFPPHHQAILQKPAGCIATQLNPIYLE